MSGFKEDNMNGEAELQNQLTGNERKAEAAAKITKWSAHCAAEGALNGASGRLDRRGGVDSASDAGSHMVDGVGGVAGGAIRAPPRAGPSPAKGWRRTPSARPRLGPGWAVPEKAKSASFRESFLIQTKKADTVPLSI